MTNDVRQVVERWRRRAKDYYAAIASEPMSNEAADRYNASGDTLEDCARELEALMLTAQPAPSGWQQRIAAISPLLDTDSYACFFCGRPRWSIEQHGHREDCLWQNAKDALPPSSSEQDPITAAVHEEPPVKERPHE